MPIINLQDPRNEFQKICSNNNEQIGRLILSIKILKLTNIYFNNKCIFLNDYILSS